MGLDGRRDVTRRGFLYGLGASIGAVAFRSLMAEEASEDQAHRDPLAPRAPPARKPRAGGAIFGPLLPRGRSTGE